MGGPLLCIRLVGNCLDNTFAGLAVLLQSIGSAAIGGSEFRIIVENGVEFFSEVFIGAAGTHFRENLLYSTSSCRSGILDAVEDRCAWPFAECV